MCVYMTYCQYLIKVGRRRKKIEKYFKSSCLRELKTMIFRSFTRKKQCNFHTDCLTKPAQLTIFQKYSTLLAEFRLLV